MMANPDIRTTPFQDLYVSPIDFDPGQPRLQLAKGDTGRIGDMEIKFTGFNLDAQGDATAAMNAGKPTTIGAMLAVTRGGQTVALQPLYTLNPKSGQVETPPVRLPGGGAMIVAGINATNGAVQLETAGVPSPMKLSVDVTRKPLIQLVWFGLYVIILGGALSTFQRLREMRLRERLAEAKAG
jgi:cytochrome c-type biogenesis protein CcmF